MEPIIDLTDPRTKERGGDLSYAEFAKMADEVRNQPGWRRGADKAADYADGNQLTSEEVAELERYGLGSLAHNLIKPAVQSILGIEAKSRTDCIVRADVDGWQDMADALTEELRRAQRESMADRACSEAYRGLITTGIGWVEVTRNSDPFGSRFRVQPVHRREMFWDWNAREYDLSDARYVIRQRWYDVDQVASYAPEKRNLIMSAGRGWTADWLERAKEDASLVSAYDQEARMSLADWEWRDLSTSRVCLHEVRYNRWVRGVVVRLPDDRVVEYDPKNPLHVAGVAQGMLNPERAVFRRWFAALMMGPHKLMDMDVPSRSLSYVPFWGYREDLTGIPYGAVRDAIPMQDEVNARRQRMMKLLASQRVFMDSDALDTRFNDFKDAANELTRREAVIILNPDRRNPNAVQVDTDLQLAAQQFELLQEAKAAIQETMGVFNAMMGRTDKATSGVANSILVEQGTNSIADLNDNYRLSRQIVFRRLLDLVVADMEGRQVTVVAGRDTPKARKVVLNQRMADPATGIEYLENDVSKAPMQVVLDEMPSTATYRAQQLTMLGEVLKSLAPEMQAQLAPHFLEATDLKDRREMAKILRRTLGHETPEGEPIDPALAQAQQQLEQLTQQAQAMEQQYQQAVAEESGKAAEMQQQLAQLQMQLKDRAAEVEVKQAELASRAREREADAALRAREIALAERKQAEDVRLREAELRLRAIELQKRQQLEAEQREQQKRDAGGEDELAALSAVDAAGEIGEPDAQEAPE